MTEHRAPERGETRVLSAEELAQIKKDATDPLRLAGRRARIRHLSQHIAWQAERLAACEEVLAKNIARSDEYWRERNDLREKLAAAEATLGELREVLLDIRTHAANWGMHFSNVDRCLCAHCSIDRALAAAPSNADGKEE